MHVLPRRTRINYPLPLTPAQCRAARALLDWSREQLADASGVAARALADFENGTTTPRPSTQRKLIAAFEAAHIAFVQGGKRASGVLLLQCESDEP